MADGDGKGIRSVGGQLFLYDWQQLRHHIPDLLFGSVAVAGDGFFNFAGRVFHNVDFLLGQGQKNDPSGVSQREDALDVLAEKHGFHRCVVRFVFIQDFRDLVIENAQPLNQWFAVVDMNDLASGCHDFPALNLQKPVTAMPAARVNAYDANCAVDSVVSRWLYS